MTGLPRNAPRGFRWADAPLGRAAVVVLSVIALSLSIFVGYRYVGLIDCLRARDAADAKRTEAIAVATDVERAADRALLTGGPNPSALRRAALDARAHTDTVRAANPPPRGSDAYCR